MAWLKNMQVWAAFTPDDFDTLTRYLIHSTSSPKEGQETP